MAVRAVDLARIRVTEMIAVDLGRVAAELEEALRASLVKDPPGASSGLITQQELFHRHRPR